MKQLKSQTNKKTIQFIHILVDRKLIEKNNTKYTELLTFNYNQVIYKIIIIVFVRRKSK